MFIEKKNTGRNSLRQKYIYKCPCFNFLTWVSRGTGLPFATISPRKTSLTFRTQGTTGTIQPSFTFNFSSSISV